MTREDILNMQAGRETDALIWLSLNDKPLNILMCRHVDGDIQPHAGYPVGHISPPHYSTDIGAAWEVVEKMRKIKRPVDIYSSVNGWIANFDYMDIALGETAPLAICRAALLAVMERK